MKILGCIVLLAIISCESSPEGRDKGIASPPENIETSERCGAVSSRIEEVKEQKSLLRAVLGKLVQDPVDLVVWHDRQFFFDSLVLDGKQVLVQKEAPALNGNWLFVNKLECQGDVAYLEAYHFLKPHIYELRRNSASARWRFVSGSSPTMTLDTPKNRSSVSPPDMLAMARAHIEAARDIQVWMKEKSPR